ncbi:MAG TPA: sulfite exporter TauE/SafE family protein, partial [Lacunisphaera sp.]|nr:sulfite exporter TauE/SafE family protein [Lacunisphaera sp.]
MLLVIGAAAAGFSKTGIPGTSILFVAIFANVMPARQATGLVLPLLIFADLFAFAVYRKNLEWPRVGRLLPWALGGVVLGWAVLGRVNDAQTARIVGAVIAIMLALHLWRKWRAPGA